MSLALVTCCLVRDCDRLGFGASRCKVSGKLIVEFSVLNCIVSEICSRSGIYLRFGKSVRKA